MSRKVEGNECIFYSCHIILSVKLIIATSKCFITSKISPHSPMALQLPFPLPLLSSSHCKICSIPFTHQPLLSPSNVQNSRFQSSSKSRGRSNSLLGPLFVNKEDTQLTNDEENGISTVTQENDDDPDPESLEYVSQIKRALELLKRNRDMLFGEVKLTIMIEDPRDVERRRLLGIDDENAPTRDDLAACLEEINDGKVPKDRVALQMLAEEMNSWPNLEAEATKQNKSRSLYAKATDTGIDPIEAAKRLKIDWDSAAEIEEAADSDEPDVPPALGYGALYLVSAFPVIIGISVVLILFYNSLQ
ncbi:ycf3-interacting protein 1, chloroplastic isoform X1 [Capsicum annuum]|uniref:ycf3-interacting protein 1, chloroplastic isoform X1 n=1 Tax=Capsicum annuum TaxID=4072 RepID=UPI0007BF5705|nr:ycf3-interacting protein 1, chloroplastic isoform X1 [Capsicum annuum]